MQEILEKIDAKDYEYMADSSKYCSVKFGGYFEYLFFPKTIEELCNLVLMLRSRQIEFKILGNMTNVIPTDSVMKGVYICTKNIKSIKIEGTRIVASCGVLLSDLCVFAQKNSLSGVEGLFGIPGSVGGAVVNNAGAFGCELSNTLESLLVLDDGQMHSISAADAKLGYRSSIFQSSKQIILSATFMLHKSNKNDILSSMMGIVTKRKNTQPSFPSAGSVFKKHDGISAGLLIDKCLLKGTTCGGAQISSKHANIFVNIGGATSKDYKTLVELAKEQVYQKFGIILEREVEYIGETNESSGRLSHT